MAFANDTGSTENRFKVAVALNNTEAIPLGQADDRYALENGNAANTFKVSSASSTDMAPQYGQVTAYVDSAISDTISSSITNVNFISGVFRQAIINGGMDVWQRGLSFTAISSASYSADRWKYNEIGSSVHNITRSTSTPDNKTNYSLKIQPSTNSTTVGAGDFTTLQYIMEGYDFKPYTWSTASTLSFYARTNSTGTYCISFRNDGNDQSLVKEYSISSTDWTQYTITNLDFKAPSTTGTWDYTNGRGLKIEFTLQAGTTYQGTADSWSTSFLLGTSNQNNFDSSTGNEFYLTQVQLYNSTASVPYQSRHYADEVLLCQRYYRELYMGGTGVYTTSTSVVIIYKFQEMRTSPSLTMSTKAVVNQIGIGPDISYDPQITASIINVDGISINVSSFSMSTSYSTLTFIQTRNDGADPFVKLDSDL